MKGLTYPPGATPLTPEELDGLRLKHITTRGELDRWEQENIQDAITWLNKRRKGAILDEVFISQLHQKMFGKVWHWAGNFRRSDKNIGVPWPYIAVELRQLLNDTNGWIEFKSYSADEIAYRFHHRLVWIHLFPNGNGRHSRLITEVLLAELLMQAPFTWGSEDLSAVGDVRKRYIAALKAADLGNYVPLAELVRT